MHQLFIRPLTNQFENTRSYPKYRDNFLLEHLEPVLAPAFKQYLLVHPYP